MKLKINDGLLLRKQAKPKLIARMYLWIHQAINLGFSFSKNQKERRT